MGGGGTMMDCNARQGGVGNIEVDMALIQKIEETCDGPDAHKAATLIQTYRKSVEYYHLNGDPAFCEVALESEGELRVLLVRCRLKRALEILHAKRNPDRDIRE